MVHIPLFAGLSVVEQARLLGKLEKVTYPQFSFICMQNDPGDCMYVLLDGQVEVFVQSSDGNQSVGRIEAGETFGEMNLLLGQPRSATVMAMTDVELFVIRKDLFDRLINEHASIANYFTRLLSNRLIKSNETLIEYKHVQFQLAVHAINKLPEQLRKIVLFSHYLPNPSLRLLGDYYGIDELTVQLESQEEASHLFTIEGDRLSLHPASLEVIQSTLAAEVDPIQFEHFVLSFVDLYMMNSLLKDAVELLLRNQLWQDGFLLIDKLLKQSPDEATQLAQAADLLDSCPNELLFAEANAEVLYFYLEAKLDIGARQGFARTEEVLHLGSVPLTEQMKLRLYEYMIAYCDKLGFEHKALEYVQVLQGLQQSAAAAGGVLDTGRSSKRLLTLARFEYENAKQMRRVGEAQTMIKRSTSAIVLSIAAVAAILALFSLLPPFSGLDESGMLFIGITLSAVLLWVVNIIPDYLVSLFMCMTWVLAGLVEPAVALSGFSSTVWLYIIVVLLFGAAMSSSGLMYRLSLHLMRIFPKTYRGQMLGIAAAGLTLNPFLPSGMTKVMLATPLTLHTADSLGFAKRSEGTAGLTLAGLLFFGYATPFFLTAGIGNFLALGLMPDFHVTFIQWIWYALPAFVIFSLLVLTGMLLLFRGEPMRVKVTDELVQEQLSLLGRMTKAEKTLIGTLLWTVGMQIVQPLHGIAGVWIMLSGVAVLILAQVLDKSVLRQSIDFTMLLHLGVAIGFSSVAAELGVARWVSEKLLVVLEPLTVSPYLFLPGLVLLIFVFSFFVFSTPAIILFIVALLPLFEMLSISPWVLLFIVLMSVDPFLLPYQSEVYLAAYYGANEDGFTHRQGRKAGLLYCVVILLLVTASIPFWQAVGLIG